MTSAASARFSAPGKLVLAGEYAVVDGFPAVVAAVSRRALAVVDVATPSQEIEVRGNDPRWVSRAESAREQPLLAAVLFEIERRGMALPAVRVAVSTTDFARDGKKLGLGSSAAAAVALASVFAHALGADTVHDIARAAHRAFQGGGSGIDVAASTYGGILTFQAGRASPAPVIPAGLDVVVAWTGVPAKTQGFVDAWRALAHRLDHAHAIDAATSRFLAALARGDASDVVRAVSDARTALAAMAAAAEIDVVTPAHQRIAELARANGGDAKPSGAGGGDVAVCFVPTDRRAALAAALSAERFDVIDVTIGEPGARRDALAP